MVKKSQLITKEIACATHESPLKKSVLMYPLLFTAMQKQTVRHAYSKQEKRNIYTSSRVYLPCTNGAQSLYTHSVPCTNADLQKQIATDTFNAPTVNS